jgi:hypothetical protein
MSFSAPASGDSTPITLDRFDHSSGSMLEKLIFNHRFVALIFCVLVTLGLSALGLSKLQMDASFEKMIPHNHPYVKNYLENRDQLRGLGDSLRIVVESTTGDIYDKHYLETLKNIHDEIVLTPGVDRAWVKSLWAPSVRWTEVTEEGFRGGPVMPDSYDGAPSATEQLRVNITRSGLLGSLVGDDFKSSMIVIPLLDKDPASGKALDYKSFAQSIEKIRERYEDQTTGSGVKIHAVGFAKLIGVLLDGIYQVAMYFGMSLLIAIAIIFFYTRCVRSTGIVITCSIVAVVWQLGIISALGFSLNPYSVLVPFLIFAIGVSHGAQKMNGIMQDIGRGAHKLVAARFTFRRLFLAGLTALLADAVGFAVLMLIDIPIIQELALTASVGVAVLVITNLILIPILLSFIGVSPRAAARSLKDMAPEEASSGFGRVINLLCRFAERRWAVGAILVSIAVTVAGYAVSTHLKIGDLDAGAPELRASSRYNQDVAYINRHFAASSDAFAVIVKTPSEGCLKYQTLVEADRLAWTLQEVPGVQGTNSLTNAVRQITAGSNEGSPKWLTISRNQDVLNYSAQQASVNNPDLFNSDCSVMPVIAYLADHRADTLTRVTQASDEFSKTHSTEDLQFLLAAGNAGIEAATNIVVKKSWMQMLLFVYAAVILLCLITFRSWRAVVVAVVPLVITSILCEALMVVLGLGVKVGTLPVIALGVGIGVDYALYLLSVQIAQQRQGRSLVDSYRFALQFTGKVVVLVGVTLAVGVVTWAFSPIKFQADMGILLAFMFIWNMIGSIILIPALSHFLMNGAFKHRGSSDLPAVPPHSASRPHAT